MKALLWIGGIFQPCCTPKDCSLRIRLREPLRAGSIPASKTCQFSALTATRKPNGLPKIKPFPDPSTLLIQPDHYIFRMLYSQGIPLEHLGIGEHPIANPRGVWHLFAKHYYLFRGTPTRLWLDYCFRELFGLNVPLSAETADEYYDAMQEKLAQPEFRPRALFEQFRIEVLATTNSPLDPLTHHQALRDSGWSGKVIPTFRPDPVVDPDFDGFQENVRQLGEMTGENTSHWLGYLSALRATRQRFRTLGCTATDHGHPNASYRRPG